VPWFYLGKLAWPANLSFVYPRWEIDAADVRLWFSLAATVAALAALGWARGRIGRGPLAAALFFGGTLFPALGFFDVYPFLFSFVADHFQYLASAGPIALAAAGFAVLRGRVPGSVAGAAAVAVLAGLGALTFAQTRIYRDPQTLWEATIERNPDAWLAHHNLGVLHFRAGREDLGMAAYDRAIALRPDYAGALANRGSVWLERGEIDRAIEDFSRAIAAQPDHVLALTHRGNARRRQGRFDLMLADFERVAALAPEEPNARLNLANALRLNGMHERAIAEYDRALAALPENAWAWAWRCDSLRALGRLVDATADCDRALALDPGNAEALRTRALIQSSSATP